MPKVKTNKKLSQKVKTILCPCNRHKISLPAAQPKFIPGQYVDGLGPYVGGTFQIEQVFRTGETFLYFCGERVTLPFIFVEESFLQRRQ